MCPHWVINGPWYNVTIFTGLCGVIFKDVYVTERKDIYELIFLLGAHDKEHNQCTDSISSGCGRPLPNKSTLKVLKFLGNTINFIES